MEESYMLDDLGGSQEILSSNTRGLEENLSYETGDLETFISEEVLVDRKDIEEKSMPLDPIKEKEVHLGLIFQFMGKMEIQMQENSKRMQENSKGMQEMKGEFKHGMQEISKKMESQISEVRNSVERSCQQIAICNDKLHHFEDKLSVVDLNLKKIEVSMQNQLDEIKLNAKDSEEAVIELKKDCQSQHEILLNKFEDLAIECNSTVEECKEKVENLTIKFDNQEVVQTKIVQDLEYKITRVVEEIDILKERSNSSAPVILEELNVNLDTLKSKVENEVYSEITEKLDQTKMEITGNVTKQIQQITLSSECKINLVEVKMKEIGNQMEGQLGRINQDVQDIYTKSNTKLNNVKEEVEDRLQEVSRLYSKLSKDIEEVKGSLDKPMKVNKQETGSLGKMNYEPQNKQLFNNPSLLNTDVKCLMVGNDESQFKGHISNNTHIQGISSDHHHNKNSEINTFTNHDKIDPYYLNVPAVKSSHGNDEQNSIAIKFMKIKMFRGDYLENPYEYLQGLEDLFTLHNLSEHEKIAIASNHLCAASRDWWWSLFDKPQTYGDFKYLLLASFWGEDRQDNLRYQVSQEKYTFTKGTYAQFFRRQAVKLKTLTAYPLSEPQIVRILHHNLPKQVEQILIAADRHSIEDAVEILDLLEVSDHTLDTRVKGIRENPHPINHALNRVSSIYLPRRYSGQKYYKGRVDHRVHPCMRENDSIIHRTQNKRSFVNDQPSTSGIIKVPKKNLTGHKNKVNTRSLLPYPPNIEGNEEVI